MDRLTVLICSCVWTCCGFRLELSLTRCKNRESSDTCENYQTMRISRFCDIINSKGKPWTPFLQKVEPPISCPIKKGLYTVNNGTFDGGAFAAMPIEGWYWKIEAKARDDAIKETVMCVYVEGQVVPV